VRTLEMRYTWKSVAPLEKYGTLGKNAQSLEKCSTLEKMRHTWESAVLLKNAQNLQKCGELGCATLGKV